MLIEKVRKTITKHGMLKKGDSVVVAVSGGVDSCALLHLLMALGDAWGLTLTVCHVNHNLRGAESRRDMLFVKRLARRMGLDFAGVTLKPGVLEVRGESLQAAARKRRLEFLDKTAVRLKANRIALGHNADDQAETLLMRFLKGSGLCGLAGIQPVRGRFIRPLIESSRKEIELFTARGGMQYVTDSSNLGTDYLRNDIRQRLVPVIRRRYNPNITATLARTAGILREDEEFIHASAEAAFSDAVIARKKGFIYLDRLKLSTLHPAVAKRVFFSAAGVLKKDVDIYSAHAAAFVEIVKGASPRASFSLPGGIVLKRVYEGIIVCEKEAVRKKAAFEVILKTPGSTRINEAGLDITAAVLRKPPASGIKDGAFTAYFDYDAMHGALTARSIRPGDRIVPFGMSGHKKIKEILIEKKVPAHLRPLVPVVCTDAGIIWMAGVKQSDMFRVTKRTKRILRLELVGTVKYFVSGRS